MSDLNSTYGALFLGLLISAVLFGVTMLQTSVYFSQYPSDRTWTKLAVSWLWLLDVVHLALSAHFVYYYLVVNYGDASALSHITWTFKIRTVVDGLIVVSVHTLYTYRLWTLLAIDNHVAPFGKEDRRWSDQKTTKSACASHWLMNRIVPWFVSGLVVIGYGIAIVMCYQTFKLDSFVHLAHAPWATYVPYCFSTVIDAFIAGSLCYFLARCRTETGTMNGPLRTLMMYTLNTGIISCVCSLVAISMMVAYPTTFISVAIELLVAKLYINSYLAMVNARSGLQFDLDRRLVHATYTPSTSIALRDVVQFDLEHKSIPFPAFPKSTHSLHGPVPPATDFAGRRPESQHPAHDKYMFGARRPSHPSSEVCPEYDSDTMETAVPPVHLRPSMYSLAERLAITPPQTERATWAGVDTDRERRTAGKREDGVDEPPLSPASSRFSTSHPERCHRPHPFASPFSASRSASAPGSYMSTRVQAPAKTTTESQTQAHPYARPQPHPHIHPQDYPSPPERTLSPLQFGSPDVGAEGESDAPSPVLAGERHPLGGEGALPLPMPMQVPMAYAVPRDRYTRMVRTARSRARSGIIDVDVSAGCAREASEEGTEVRRRAASVGVGKPRRGLFDERGVAVLWGLREFEEGGERGREERGRDSYLSLGEGEREGESVASVPGDGGGGGGGQWRVVGS